MKILSIDAWGNKKEGFDWNQWFDVGTISKEEFEQLTTAKETATWFFTEGYTNTDDMRRIDIEDDGYNVVIHEKKTQEPLFAIEYGPEY